MTFNKHAHTGRQRHTNTHTHTHSHKHIAHACKHKQTERWTDRHT